MENVLLILIISAVIAFAVFYLIREKKKGKACVGCPYGGKCAGGCKDSK